MIEAHASYPSQRNPSRPTVRCHLNILKNRLRFIIFYPSLSHTWDISFDNRVALWCASLNNRTWGNNIVRRGPCFFFQTYLFQP